MIAELVWCMETFREYTSQCGRDAHKLLLLSEVVVWIGYLHSVLSHYAGGVSCKAFGICDVQVVDSCITVGR